MSTSRLPYHGLERKLAIAFDCGTTYSGISYAILDPGEVPQIRGVTRYPAQEAVGGDSKIPSILYYNAEGEVCAVGAEAMQESIVEQAEDEKWSKLEWWKLHLRPKGLASSQVNDDDLPPLPARKTAVDVLSDFMKYLFQCAETFIKDTHSPELWASVADNIDFVLTHPNGWEGAQQAQIRRAAVRAGLVLDSAKGQSRLQLLTEGEASLHFCIANGLTSDSMTNGKGIMIVDAGGGTIDLSAYYMCNEPLSFEEIAPTECRLQGSVFVTRRARTFLAEKLALSKYGSPEDLANMTSCFDKTTKLRFRNPDEPSYIKFGGVRDRDPDVGIRSGQLKLPGTEVAALFEPSADSIIEAIDKQRNSASKPIAAIFLVGGFAASDWLFSKLQAHLTQVGIMFSRPDNHVNKAVADGAMTFYLDHRVSARVAPKTYGMDCSTIFKKDDPAHVARMHTLYTGASGHQYVQHKFTSILPKGERVSEDKEFRRTYCQTSRKKELGGVSGNPVAIDIICYRGALEDVQWTDMEPEMFSTLCTIKGDTTGMSNALKARRSPEGVLFYQLDFSVVLMFGLTELKAHLSWVENGEEKQTPARIVYDMEETISDA
ncbi:hypothetical protein FIBSPDRAFT_546789 [Athelia psychrophila]|uniref:Actin-like ATPase domain-containing protein n=1 Tax=Athelia psychrophila TaxID=1759441 RepID=A0A166IQH7_9AGAM|nr:hypothetical protein FIBSPDRAFT_546789 [Fibularhizoctonia sp. CBS 109695]